MTTSPQPQPDLDFGVVSIRTGSSFSRSRGPMASLHSEHIVIQPPPAAVAPPPRKNDAWGPSTRNNTQSDPPAAGGTAEDSHQDTNCAALLYRAVKCVAMTIMNFWFFNSIEEGDDFIMKLRKLCLGGFVIGSFAYMTVVVTFLDVLPILQSSNTTVLNKRCDGSVAVVPLDRSALWAFSMVQLLAIALPIVVVSWVPFIYCRMYKKAPDWTVVLPVIAGLVGEVNYAIIYTGVDIQPIALCYFVALLCCNVRHVWLPLLLAVAALAINALQSSGTLMLGLTPPGPWSDNAYRGSFGQYIATSGVGFLLISGILRILVHEFWQTIGAATTAAVVSRELAEKLRRYDTDSARAVLRRYRGTPATTPPNEKASNDARELGTDVAEEKEPEEALKFVVDQSLLDVFEGIIENLELYRPHLPNYLIERNQSETESKDDENAHEEDAARAGDDEGSVGSFRDIEEVRSQGTSIRVTREVRLLSAQVITPERSIRSDGEDSSTGRLARGSSMASSHRSGGKGPGAAAGPSNAYPPAAAPSDTMLSAAAMHRSRVVVCLVGTAWSDSASSSNPKVPGPAELSDTAARAVKVTQQCNAVVTLAGEVATLTQASLHAFVGDQLVATWNATKRTVKPESKACQFAVKLREGLGCTALKGAVTASMMVASQMAESCFAGDTKIRLFACSSPELWRVARCGLLKVTELSVTAAIDKNTKDQAQFDFSTRGLAVMQPPPASAIPTAMTLDAGVESVASSMSSGIKADLRQPATCLFTLLSERQATEHDEEWMYSLEQQGSKDDPNEVLSAAVVLLSQGRADHALKLVSGLAPDHPIHLERGVASLIQDIQRRAGVTLPDPTTL